MKQLTEHILRFLPFLVPLLPGAASCTPQTAEATEQVPELISIIPTSGESGCTAIISGNGFSEKASENTVVFGDIPAEIISSTKDRLTVIAPQHEEGQTDVKVETNGKNAGSLHFKFVKLTEPELKISGLNPTSGFAGEELTVYGENFSDEPAGMTVTFDGTAAKILLCSSNFIKVSIPEHERGDAIVRVTKGAKSASIKFTYIELSISRNMPAEGGKGTVVTIYGEGFSETASQNAVTVGGTAAEVTKASGTALEVLMPELPAGTYSFTIKTRGRECTGGSFTVAPLWYVETVAGTGEQTCIDGIGTAAGLGIMQHIAQAPDGMLWMTQRGGKGKDAIRVLNPKTWEVTTAAGTDNAVISNSHPWGAAFASDGSLYIAGKAKGKVFRIAKDGTVGEVALPAHKLSTNPMCVLLDDSDNLYLLNRNAGTAEKPSYISVYDKNLNLIKDMPVLLFAEHMAWNRNKSRIIIGTTGKPFGLFEFNPGTGDVKMIAGTGEKPTADTFSDGEEGNPSTASIGTVEGIATADDGTIYFSDVTAFLVRKLIPGEGGDYTKGTVKTVAGSAVKAGTDDGLATNATFKYPCGIMPMEDGSLIVADGTGYVIRRIYSK